MTPPTFPLSFRNRLILLIGALLIVVGASGYFVVLNSQQHLIESQAVQVAKIITRQAAVTGTMYTEEILGKIEADQTGFSDVDYQHKKGALPITSLFMKNLAQASSAESGHLYEYRLVSKWNLAEDQYLTSPFLKSAWKDLEKQDRLPPKKRFDWIPTYKTEDIQGTKKLVFLSAIPVLRQSCANCHNNYEKRDDIIKRRQDQGVEPLKEWKVNELLGAIYVEIPLESMQTLALKESTQTMLWILAILTGGFSLLALFLIGDFSKARRATKALYWQARHDSLTQLPNRMSFEKRANKLIQSAKAGNAKHAMFYLDLDQFKVVNDTCGHATGDLLLIQISKELQTHVPKPHILARLGGDEFGVLLENTSINKAEALAKILCSTVKNYHFLWQEHSFDIGVSIGVVEINKNSANINQVMRCADLACYAAKESGRNRTHIYLEADEEMAIRKGEMSWVPRLLKALQENRIIIYSQKIVSVNKQAQHVHREVLVRLLDETGNLVPPNEFLPAAERYDLMSKLDLAIIRLSLSALQKNAFKDISKDGFISINISGQSFGSDNFLLEVQQLITDYKVNARQLCFEITESTAISSPTVVLKFMAEMKKLGVRFALDDFGTGLSSLTYLKQFPVDYLKIDGSFIKDIVTNQIDRSLVVAISQMANTMQIKTVAEYVESEEILSLLQDIKVDYVQGYYIEKPKPVVIPS